MFQNANSHSLKANLLQLLLYVGIFVSLSYLLLLLALLLTPKKEKEIFVQNPESGLGLGQCHWIGGPFDSNPGIEWGYASSTYFDFSNGEGDSWAAVEPQQGVFRFDQIRRTVDYVRSKNKQIILQIQTSANANKEHNVPKWAIDQGVEMYVSAACGDTNFYRNKSVNKWYDNTSTHTLKNSVKPVWDNPQFVDKSDATLLTANGAVTTDLSLVDRVQFVNKIPAVWDPKYRELYRNTLRAMKQEFQQDIDDGIVVAVNMMSGGQDGECVLGYKCAVWDTGCIPDVVNPQCPLIQSMAKFVQKQHYPSLTIDQVARDIVAKKSNCDPSNVIPGNKVQLCTQTDQSKCPTAERGSACYVFDDYFIQAVKEIIKMYVEIFAPTPLVWQQGNGISGTGRVSSVLQTWMNDNYQYNFWFKFNGWGSRDRQMWSRGFNNYSNIGAHGYEPDHPNNFTKDYYKANAQTWCDNYLSKECRGDINCLPVECSTNPLNTEAVGRRAAAIAVQRGIVDDKSSLLCMQDDFFLDSAIDTDSDGLKENKYYFNPTDQDPNCSSSEVNVRDFGVGFCPGFLNSIMKANAMKYPNSTFAPSPTTTVRPTSTSIPTNPPTARPTVVPTATATVIPTATPGSGGINFSCTGVDPVHASICSNDATGLTVNTPKTLVSVCTADRKCEYVCNNGYVFNNGSCNLTSSPSPGSNYSCIGTVPTHSQACSGYQTGLTMNMNLRLIDNCSGNVLCAYVCSNGYHRVNQQCVANTSPTPTPTVTPTATPTPNSNNQNQTNYACYDRCQYDSQCNNSLLCRSVDGTNRCINLECPKDTDCSCNPTNPKDPGLPKSGYMPLPFRILIILTALGFLGTITFMLKRKRG